MDQYIKDWSEVHDHLPLKQRLKLLRNFKVEQQASHHLPVSAVDVVVKKEEQECVLQDVDSAHLLVQGRVERFPVEECHYGRTQLECCIPKIEQETCCSPNHIIESELNGGVTRAEACCDNQLSSTVNCLHDRCSAEVKAINSNSEIPAYFLDDLDHVDLKERRRMLLSRFLYYIYDIF